MPELKEGQPAPDFKLPSSKGGELGLKDLRGKQVVLYFYPKDDTEGCTIEACEFAQANPKISRKDAVVLGLSPDGLDSHAKFIEKFKLPFALLADEGHKVCGKYGVWVEKHMYGRTYMGVQRSTFLIDPAGSIKKIWPKVKAKGHAAEVLAEL